MPLRDANVLITGGTGSFGKKCVEVLLRECPPRRLVVFSRDEQKHVDMMRNHFPPERFPQMRYFVGDVRDRDRLARAMRGIDFVIHAAAMKHVDFAEYNPQECIHTNIGGAQNVIDAAIDCGVKKVIALSTDKAASPINLYGATKLCSDKLFVAANHLSGATGPRFAVVRYGNVVGSKGSVIPFFIEKRKTGVFPITDPRMTRFWITLQQGVQLVLTSFETMNGGELFVPKIPSMNIMELAAAVGPECRTEIVGIRPGEKLHECMITVDDARHTIDCGEYYVIQPAFHWWQREWTAKHGGKPVAEDFTYSSDINTEWLDREALRRMIDTLEIV
ncbi:MAG: UDP-N-acetylglucosamine 4,6-dehydratase (inverting) [Candidatus Sumerlaeia bacterium]|nr:UDP-N-acetylglucosamine 4,6-dehydratase (inverting) [Candidatus Sumerlaeia bacterium]